MSKVIGRIKEIETLEYALNSQRPELVAVYGRRRIGKTFLIRETFRPYTEFEITGLHNGTLKSQLANFHHILSQKDASVPKVKTWLGAFHQLEHYFNKLKGKRRKVIFIDEFPWLATPRSGFLSAFEVFWNSYVTKRDDILVAICGSSASYMVKNILRNRGGLYNRLTQRIRLLPFNLYETELLLKAKGIKYSHYDILQIYMALGGVPHYLEKLKKGESVAQAIDRLCFADDAPLKAEFKDVFASLFSKYERHIAIVRTLAKSKKGLKRKDIAAKSKLHSGGRLTLTLQELEESGFIQKYNPFRNVKKDALYRLVDEYSLFYLKFIEHDASSGEGAWLSKANSHAYKAWAGFNFETLCIKHVEQLKKALGIGAVYTENYSWIQRNEERGAQIDLLLDRADNVINICEMKFHNSPYTVTKRYADDIRNKVWAFGESSKTRKALFFTMVTTYGIKQNHHSLGLVQNELTMECLFVPD